mgnify:CR=1 FL=1
MLRKSLNRRLFTRKAISYGELIKNYNFPLKIIRSKRNKRAILSISCVERAARLSVPLNLSAIEAKYLVDAHADRIEEKLLSLGKISEIKPGIVLPFFGLNKKLLIDKNLDFEFQVQKNFIRFPQSDNKTFNEQVKDFLKKTASNFFSKSCDTYAAELKTSYIKVNVRDPKTRWGSCSSQGNLMFSWRLIMAPIEISDYVAAHEVCHLLHLDHGLKFWNKVQAVCPNYKEHRSWLRENGKVLHNYLF